MRKGLKKLVAIVLTATMVFSIGAPAFAQTPYDVSEEVMIQANDLSTSVPQELVGMDSYLSIDEDGTIALDMTSALAAGYSEIAVLGVKSHLDSINEQILTGNMVVGENFNAYSVSLSQSSISPRGGSATNDGNGYSGYISTWYGALFIFFDKIETIFLLQGFNNLTDSCNTIINNLTELKNSPGMSFEDEERQGLDDAIDLVIVGAGTIGQSAILSSNAISTASTSQKGVSWYIQQDFNTGIYSWAFEAQNYTEIKDLIKQHGS